MFYLKRGSLKLFFLMVFIFAQLREEMEIEKRHGVATP
jgi:hypothetical protein